MFLSFDELPEDERPPRRIWLDGDAMKNWMDEVKRKREAKAKGKDREIEDPVQNDAASMLVVG